MRNRVSLLRRKRRYLDASTEDVMPTGYDPARDEDPERVSP
jgi:hypothetical protein